MLDGAARLDDLFERTAELGMGAIAMTDHGNVFGAYEFYTKATRPGDQADHRPRGLLHAQHRPPGAQAGALERRRRRRRVGRWRLHAHDAAGRDRRWACTTCSGSRRAPRSRASTTSPGPTVSCSRSTPQGLIGTTGCPSGEVQTWLRIGDYDKARAVGGGVPGHLRPRQLLPRADGPRALDRDAGPRRPAAAVEGPRHPADRDQRLPLRPPGRRALARAPAVRVVRQRDDRPQAVQARRRRLLHQVRRRDAGACGATSARRPATTRC